MRRLEGTLFALVFLTFSYFHQGGGWNQNCRFAMVRAMAEQHRFSIDSYLIYVPDPASETKDKLNRLTIEYTSVFLPDKTYSLCWMDSKGQLVPISNSVPPGAVLVAVDQIAATGDVSYFDGHFHPNKAPGTSFLALPAYYVLGHIEKLFGIDPDSWWVLTCNAWLTSVFSVGLISALGSMVFFRLSVRLSGDLRAALISTLAFTFGTMYFPYATMLYEHNIIAAALLASFALIYRLKLSPDVCKARTWLVLSGMVAAFAAITNYLAVLVVPLLTVYAFLATGKRSTVAWFGLGTLGPFLLLCAYNVACFGTPLTTNYRYQNPIFLESGGVVLGVLNWPSGEVFLKLLLSPYRGLLLASPVLVLGIVGLASMFGQPGFRLEAWLFTCVILVFLLFNVCFNGWDGGWTTVPRYLGPSIPFLALPIVLVVKRYFWTTLVLAVISVAIHLLFTVVDPQSPAGNAGIASIPQKPQWRHSPLLDYELPLFMTGRAQPILDQQRDALLTQYQGKLFAEGIRREDQGELLAKAKHQLDLAIECGDPEPLPLASFFGPVSVNPSGVYEAWFHRYFTPGSTQAEWNSFNVGEFLFPHSRLSLLPLVVLWAGLLLVIVRQACG